MSWNKHIDNIAKKANSTRAFLQRNIKSCPSKTKALCYQTLVRPLMEYSSTIWDPSTKDNINKLEAIQRRCARFVLNDYRRTSSVTSMLQALNWKTLQERRAQCKVIMFYRVVHELIAVPTTNLQPVISTVRGHNERFLVPYARTQVYRHSFFPDTIRIWNGLPQHIVSCTTLESFKRGVQVVQLR